MPFYIVGPLSGSDTKQIVKAATKQQALRHVACQAFAVTLATTDEIVDLMSQGVPVNVAGAESAED